MIPYYTVKAAIRPLLLNLKHTQELHRHNGHGVQTLLEL